MSYRPEHPPPVPDGPYGPRSHRRSRKRGAGKLGLAGALGGAIAMAAVTVGIVVFRPPGGNDPQERTAAGNGAPGGLPSTQAAATGSAMSFTTPEGYGYRLAAVKPGSDPRPGGARPAPEGETYAHADYVLTNSGQRPALLDYPADLFLPLDHVPDAARERCMPQPGIPEDMCTLPNSSRITARVNGARAPIREAGDTLLPAGASYMVRITTDVPVKDDLRPEDLKLYVWNARFTSDRKGVEVAFP